MQQPGLKDTKKKVFFIRKRLNDDIKRSQEFQRDMQENDDATNTFLREEPSEYEASFAGLRASKDMEEPEE